MNFIGKNALLDYNKNNNKEALNAIISLRNYLDNTKSLVLKNKSKTMSADFNVDFPLFYLEHLYRVKLHIDEKNYIKACWEIGSLEHRFCLLNIGLRENLVDLLSMDEVVVNNT